MAGFMVGRYGPDELYSFLIRLYIFIFIIDIFIDYKILNILELFIVVIMLYRFFSKNISSRRKENQQYLKLKKKELRLKDELDICKKSISKIWNK